MGLSAALLTTLLLAITLLIFLTTRHIQLTTRRPFTTSTAHTHDGDYYLFVLGSGGHTKEMLMMMDDGTAHPGLHRRYLVSSGDTMSEAQLLDYERDLAGNAGEKKSGTFDVCTVRRARRVHQPLWSVPYTALLSILDIFPILLNAPPAIAARGARFPRRIYSNGPATGFFVGLAAHLLKMAYIAPPDRLGIIYIESWARISTLSLTGKLFHYTDIADALLVQHHPVAARYNIRNAGEMVFNARK